jgi:enolase
MSKYTINNIRAREILDSRGDPTIEVTVLLEGGAVGVAGVPSGASTGVHEALELRDGDKTKFDGKGVLKAVENVNSIVREALKGQKVTAQTEIDNKMNELDGTSNKHILGANAMLGVSLACAKAAAQSEDLPLYDYLQKAFNFPALANNLPLPMMNIINGGRHADTKLQVQEFMIVPRVLDNNGKVNADECVRIGAEVFHHLGGLLKSEKLDTDVGNEGGYAPDIDTAERALNFITSAITNTGYTPGKEVSLALDVAASEFFSQGKYSWEDKKLGSSDMVSVYKELLKKYPIISIEDGLSQDDWQGWHELTDKLGDKVMLVGDDLFVTNVERLKLGVQFKAANATIIKPNQIGTLTETIATIKFAQENNYTVIISHRSGETMDTFITDLAVACGAPYLKAGSASRGERVAKYNRLMEIEEELKIKS